MSNLTTVFTSIATGTVYCIGEALQSYNKSVSVLQGHLNTRTDALTELQSAWVLQSYDDSTSVLQGCPL